MLILALLLQTQAPLRGVADPGVIATNQKITPAGVQSVFVGRVTGLRFAPSGDAVWVAVPGSLTRLGWATNQVEARIAFAGDAGVYGITLDPHTGAPLLSLAGRLRAGAPRAAGVAARGTVAQLGTVAGDTLVDFGGFGTDIAGAPAAAATANPSGHRVAVLPLPANDALAVVDADDGTALASVPLGVVPIAAVVSRDGATAWVSEMAGAKPVAGEPAVAQCCDPHAESVRVDARGIAARGSVSRIDVTTGRVARRITVGLHPTAMAWDERRSLLFVADGNSDQVTVVDTRHDTVTATIPIAPFRPRAIGLAPTALALSPDGSTLFVALGGVNAVAIYDVGGRPAAAKLRGLLPTAWYPTTLDVSRDGRFLAVGTLLGPGAGTGKTSGLTGRYVHADRGAVNVLEIPTATQLAAFTVAVAANNRLTLAADRATPSGPRAGVAARAVPERPGEPSLIRHVIYVVKENRTYDQVLGDLPRGDGDSALVQYGRDVTPNQHALAEQYVTFDRFFASGGNSADGHQWLTQANETEYTLWPLYSGRSYPYDGTDPLAYSSGGFIWDAAASRGRSVEDFGEFAHELSDSGAASRQRFMDQYRAASGGGSTPLPVFDSHADIPSLDRVLVRDFPTWTLGVPDVVRAEIFIAHLHRWEAGDSMPNLVLLQLPSNHTAGTTPGWCTPKACVADNDLALGQVVEAVSHSRFWSSTAILVVEDDAQNGVDHVDGHRSVLLAVSPYSRRGMVDSTFYNHPSVLKTIELMLGLPALSMFDLVASDLGHAFIGPGQAPDLAPFTAIQPRQSIYEVNPRTTGLRGAQRAGAVASSHMRFDIPDAAPSDALNRILWHDARGWKTPFPGVRQALFFPMSHDVPDSQRDDDDDGHR